MGKAITVVLGFFLSVSLALMGQEGVPVEILQRTMLVKVGSTTGTAFVIDHGGKMYLVTARHLMAGLPTEGAVIQINQQNQWRDYHTTRTLFPSSADVDIAVLETAEKVPTPYGVTIGKTAGITLGQQVWFLGFPYGLATKFGKGGVRPDMENSAVPFIKRGTMSAIDGSDPNAVVIYIDGFNNPGFSGGPVLYWNYAAHTYEILGVVMGYREDSAKVLVNGQHVDTNVLVNTGILVAYSIQHAIEAIDHSNVAATPAH
jgi:S1-C subfamily serine protease